MGKVLIIGEQRNGQLKTSITELVSAARVLGDEIRGAVLGKGASSAAQGFGAYGIGVVRALETDTRYTSDGFAAALSTVVEECGVEYIVLMQSFFGRDLGARLAARLGAAFINDVTDLAMEDGRVVATKPLYAGKIIGKVAATGDGPKVITLRPKNFAPAEPLDAVNVEVKPLELPAELKCTVTEIAEKEAGMIDLKEADIIISGGRATGGPEGFEPLRELAKSIGAALGSSRAAVDAGWIEHSFQVGQTGKVVNPQLYIAFGISGAIQHLAGMQTSKVIVAVNTNPDAPIFKIADYGIIEDMFKVAPVLKEQMVAALSS